MRDWIHCPSVSQSLTTSDDDDGDSDGEAPNDTRRGHAISRRVVQSGAATLTHLHATPVTGDDGLGERRESGMRE